MAATATDLEKINTTLISLMKRLDGIDQRMEEQGKKIDSLSGDLRDTMQQVRAHNLAILKLEKGMPNCSGTTDDKQKRSDAVLPRAETDLKAANNHPPRFFKMEFPIYDGEVDPLVWLNRCEQFFDTQRTPSAEKVGLASFHLTGDAQLCNALGELISFKRTGTVADFNKKFNALLCRAPQLPEDQVVSIYTTNLQDPLQMDVEMWIPGSLLDAMSLARSCERRAQWTPATVQQQTQDAHQPCLEPDAPAVPAAPPPGKVTTAAPANTPRRTQSPAAMANRREQGLCYNCDERYVPGHRCKKLFVLVIDPDAVDDVEDTH
ncbi:unnamed protein product [Alopecurus aequalis]